MFQLNVPRGRKVSWTVQVEDAAGDDSTIASGDVVRFKLYRRNNSTPSLDLNSDDDTSNVAFTAGTNDVTLTLLQANTSGLTPDVYSAEVSVVDSSESDAIKQVEDGIVVITATGGGDVDNPA